MDGKITQAMDRLESEAVLLQRSAAGDLEAFEGIVNTYRGRAYRYALSIVKNHHDALDLSQDAFARAFRSLKRFDTSRPFLPWFMRIVRNLSINNLAQRGRRPENPGPVEGGEVMQFLPSPSERPDAAAARSDRAEHVRAALDLLSSEHREVIFLRHFDDMSYEEIAQALDIPVGTVMSRLFNARRNLAEILKSDRQRV
ncbi:MAG: RNA polymerase sigma factor [Kiritimatiellae bacterium]|nr:RNA polymerase sigma factor [Kiritimatiellia bacterium]